MLLEIFRGLVAIRLLHVSLGLGTSVSEPVRRGLLLVPAPLGALARNTKIDNLAHVQPKRSAIRSSVMRSLVVVDAAVSRGQFT
jgi:hypothetical protein